MGPAARAAAHGRARRASARARGRLVAPPRRTSSSGWRPLFPHDLPLRDEVRAGPLPGPRAVPQLDLPRPRRAAPRARRVSRGPRRRRRCLALARRALGRARPGPPRPRLPAARRRSSRPLRLLRYPPKAADPRRARLRAARGPRLRRAGRRRSRRPAAGRGGVAAAVARWRRRSRWPCSPRPGRASPGLAAGRPAGRGRAGGVRARARRRPRWPRALALLALGRVAAPPRRVARRRARARGPAAGPRRPQPDWPRARLRAHARRRRRLAARTAPRRVLRVRLPCAAAGAPPRRHRRRPGRGSPCPWAWRAALHRAASTRSLRRWGAGGQLRGATRCSLESPRGAALAAARATPSAGPRPPAPAAARGRSRTCSRATARAWRRFPLAAAVDTARGRRRSSSGCRAPLPRALADERRARGRRPRRLRRAARPRLRPARARSCCRTGTERPAAPGLRGGGARSWTGPTASSVAARLAARATCWSSRAATAAGARPSTASSSRSLRGERGFSARCRSRPADHRVELVYRPRQRAASALAVTARGARGSGCCWRAGAAGRRGRRGAPA